MMKGDAIIALNPNVVSVTEFPDGTVICTDADGNEIDIDHTAQAVVDKDTELTNARKLDYLREVRDKKLAETDHWAYQDTADMTQAQRDYRQSLRDITDTYTSLDDVVWPTKP